MEPIVKRLASEDSDERRWAVYDLENFDSVLTIDYLIAAIQDEHRAVRKAASEIVATTSPAVCVKKLVPLLGSVRIEVRNIVASVLFQFGDEALDDLLHALTHKNEDVRKFGADILGLSGSAKAVPGLCKAVMEDEAENVVTSAIEALGKIGSKDALPILYRSFNEKESMKTELAEAIGLIGEAESATFLEKEIDNNDLLVGFAIIDALGNIADIRSLPALKEYLTISPPILKEHICRAILKIGSNNKENVLNNDQSGLGDTIAICIDHDCDNIVDLLAFQLTLNPDFNVMKTFFNQVEKLPSNLVVTLINTAKKDKRFVDKICDLANHDDDWVAYTALEALANFDKQQVKNTIMSMLNEDRGLPVIAAVKSASKLKLDRVKPILEDLKRSENEDIRRAAGAALEKKILRPNN